MSKHTFIAPPRGHVLKRVVCFIKKVVVVMIDSSISHPCCAEADISKPSDIFGDV